MKKLCLIFCVMLLLTSQALAYDVVDSYPSVDGVLIYVVRMDDGTTQEMTRDEYLALLAQQQEEAAQDVQEPQEGQVITASGDVIDYADYDAYYEENPSALPQDTSSGAVYIRSYTADTADDQEGSMKYVVRSIFGDYTPVTESVTTYLADGSAVTSTQVVAGVAGVDWPFICGVALFSILLYSFLRLLGVILHV